MELLFLKKLKSVCSLKGSLYGGRELLSELGSWLSSFIYMWGGEREFVSGWGLGFHLHMRKDHAWVIICKGISGLGILLRFGLIWFNFQ